VDLAIETLNEAKQLISSTLTGLALLGTGSDKLPDWLKQRNGIAGERLQRLEPSSIWPGRICRGHDFQFPLMEDGKILNLVEKLVMSCYVLCC